MKRSSEPLRRDFSKAEKVALYLVAEGKCSVCGSELDKGWEADHIVPYSIGGPTDVANGQALCRACNRRKGCKS